MVLLAVLTSFYFCPIEFTCLPGVNTKMARAGFGWVLLVFRLARQGRSMIDSDFFHLSLWAALVSLAGFATAGWKDTYEYTYAT